MNANQIAHLMHAITQAYFRGEVDVGEYTGIAEALVSQAREAGIRDEAMTAYNQMCLAWHALSEASAA